MAIKTLAALALAAMGLGAAMASAGISEAELDGAQGDDDAMCALQALQMKAGKLATKEEAQDACTSGFVGEVRNFAPACISACSQACGPMGSAMTAYMTTRDFADGMSAAKRVICANKGIAAGIAYLHSKKLVHADLKSSNILVDYTSSEHLIPKICDFGHVAVRTHPAPHDRCGTPHWAAPEALRNEAVSPAADVFSLGVMLWEMCARMLPHHGFTFAQVVGAVGYGAWTPDLELLPEVPEALRDLLCRCWRFVAAERPSIVEVRAELRRLLRRPRREALAALFTFCGGRSSD